MEQQLDVLQQKKGPLPPGSGISIDQADQLATDIQTTNDVTFDERFTVPGNSSLRAPPSSGVPAVVFPSVKNKPSAEAGALDGADALLTGVTINHHIYWHAGVHASFPSRFSRTKYVHWIKMNKVIHLTLLVWTGEGVLCGTYGARSASIWPLPHRKLTIYSVF